MKGVNGVYGMRGWVSVTKRFPRKNSCTSITWRAGRMPLFFWDDIIRGGQAKHLDTSKESWKKYSCIIKQKHEVQKQG